jgi:hypothetical protein
MVEASAADDRRVIHRMLVWAAVACSALVFSSFALFARDQLAGASKHQVNELASGVPATTTGIAPVRHGHAQPRKFIDGAASRLESPFQTLVPTKNAWAQHLILVALALLVYGVGIGWLARFASGLAHGVHRSGDAVST